MKKINDADLEKVNGGNGICGGAVSGPSEFTIANCENITGSPTGTEYAGGICGSADSQSSITDCYNSGTIAENAIYGGGFVGKV